MFIILFYFGKALSEVASNKNTYTNNVTSCIINFIKQNCLTWNALYKELGCEWQKKTAIKKDGHEE